MYTINEYLQMNYPDPTLIDQLYVYDRYGNPTIANGNAVCKRIRVTHHTANHVDIEIFLI